MPSPTHYRLLNTGRALPLVCGAAALLCACGLARPAPSPADPLPSTTTEAGIDTSPTFLPPQSALGAIRTRFDVPGAAVATLRNCELEGVTISGMASLTPPRPVTAGTRFEAASLSKPVFAHLVLQLADEGVIDLDAPFASASLAPRVADTDALAALTPRMVLTHRTGLPNWSGDSADPSRTTPLAFEAEPGTQFSYSGEAFEILRVHVENITGMSLESLFRIRLGDLMPHSSFASLPELDARSRGYASGSEPWTARDLTAGRNPAAGGLVTTASDYAAFLSAVCKGQRLSPATQTDMLRPQSAAPIGDYPAPTSWGLGWSLMDMGAETIIAHGGNNGEFRSFAAFVKETGEGYVILTNAETGQDMIRAFMEATGS